MIKMTNVLPAVLNAALIAAVVCAVLLPAAVPAAATVNATICGTPSNAELTTAILHAKHAVSYYASNYSNVAFTFKMLGTTGLATSKNYVTAWVLAGAGCDAYVGPGYSRLALPISPLIEPSVAWVDPFATSVELSNKDDYPTFSRVIPSDKVAAKMAAFAMKDLGWNDINILCLEDAYGRSISTGMNEAISTNGGTTHVSRCVLSSDPISRAITILKDMRDNSPTKIVFMAMLVTVKLSDGRLFFDVLVEEIIANSLDKSLIFFFSEAACSGSIFTYANLSSSLCATYTTNQRFVPFYDSYKARNTAQDAADVTAVGVTPSAVNLVDTSIVAALMHDAALHAMGTISTKAQSTAAGTMVDFVRRQTTLGATGDIALDVNGDRQLADARVYNGVGGQQHVVVGVVEGGSFTFTNTAGVKQSTPPTLRLLGQSTTTVPSALNPVTPASTSNTKVLLIALCTGIGLLIVLVIAVGLVLFVCRSNGRDNRNAPTDQARPFTVMFTDIQASTALWARAPEQMSTAVERHHALIRGLIAKHGGYEVKTIGDAFMIAFTASKPAVALAMALQGTFFDADWGTDVLDDTYRELARELAPDYVDFEDYDRDWCGLRVRVGIHHGKGTITQDEVTNGYDYFGTVVNTAARVEAASHGGQTCVTDEVLEQLGLSLGRDEAPALPGVVVNQLGPQPLRGLNQAVNMTQLLPNRFASRLFPALRLDVDVDVVDEDTPGGTDTESKWDIGTVKTNASEVPLGHVANRVAARIARKAGTDMDTERTKVLDLVDYTKALFSTSKTAFRIRTIAEIAQKWRTPVDERRMAAHDAAYELALIKIVERVSMTLDASKRHGYDRRGSGHGHEHLIADSHCGSSEQSKRSHISGQFTTGSPKSPGHIYRQTTLPSD